MTGKFQIFDEFPKYENYQIVGGDKYVIGEGKEILGTDGVSSSLAISLYNPKNKIGILAHILGVETSPDEVRPEKITDTLLEQLNISGEVNYKKLEATLAGESILFEGKRSSPIVRKKLQDYKIPIIGEDLCEVPEGRLVFLNCDTGKVEVYRYSLSKR